MQGIHGLQGRHSDGVVVTLQGFIMIFSLIITLKKISFSYGKSQGVVNDTVVADAVVVAVVVGVLQPNIHSEYFHRFYEVLLTW